MALTIVTPADSTRLASVADVMDELGCPQEDLPTLENIVQQVSDTIVTYCGRQFAKQSYQETVAGFGDVHLILQVCPLVSVSQVLISGSPITDYTLQEPESGMLYREAGWRWSAVSTGRLMSKPYPYSEEQIFTVDYIAGYDLPDAMLPNLPGDVERAAILTAKDWFANRERNHSIKSIKTSDVSIEYLENEMPPTALRLLSRWRSVEL